MSEKNGIVLEITETKRGVLGERLFSNPPLSESFSRPESSQSHELMGLPLCALPVDAWTKNVSEAVMKNRRLIVVGHNLHGAFLGRRDPELQNLWNDAFGQIDGMALVFLGRLLGHPLTRGHRVTWVDWIGPLMREAARESWRVFFLGGKPGVGVVAAEKLRQANPGLCIEIHHGFFDQRVGSGENERVLAKINDAKPDLLLVGLGMPRQEHWISRNRDRLSCVVIVTCGAAMDYVAGEISTPPRWMGRWGLEWLYRFLCEPRRLFGRYFVEPWFLIGPFWRDLKAAYRNRRNVADWVTEEGDPQQRDSREACSKPMQLAGEDSIRRDAGADEY